MSSLITTLAQPPEFSSGDAIYMDAVLRPNRSLSKRGFLIFMLALIAMSISVSLVFISIGAWPIVGFFGLDVLLVYLAFKANFKAGTRECETVKVSASQIAISKTCPKGRVGWWRVPPSFARVVIEEHKADEAKVVLAAGGGELPLANCLSSDERRAFGAALKVALHQARSERYATETSVYL
ncbi:DUF2244 domain-containing protein [Candidatus Phycosocius spiralis]|uniref:Membrane protein n=1 Tax=Candidatus Phycosocius spiralis TaxID=2815099 RepID=A0ABQ4PWT1_9PROT|nr:DUF2244 domain-containing protein [Candidatus Phycosocius spiralis]GIU67128.1 membrane protein [Candidatus Phycosocius spiralis]